MQVAHLGLTQWPEFAVGVEPGHQHMFPQSPLGGFQFLDSTATAKKNRSRLPSLSWHNGPAGLRSGRIASPSAGFGWASAYGKGSDEVHGILNPGELAGRRRGEVAYESRTGSLEFALFAIPK